MNLIIKPTNRCNMNCTYCFENRGNNTLTKEEIEKAIKLGLDYGDKLHVIWHGGEPTLLPVEFYKEIMGEFKGEDITWSMQTNGSLLDSKWMDFIEEANIHTSVSFDVELEGCRPFNKNTAEIMKSPLIQPITVLTRWNIQKANEIYEYFKQNYNDKVLCFNLAYDAPHREFSLLPSQYKQYALFLTSILADKENNAMEERNLTNYLKSFADEPVTLCVAGCAYQWLTLNARGEFYACDRHQNPSHLLDHLSNTESISHLFKTDNYLAHLNEGYNLNTKCHDCKYWVYCYDRCPMNHQNPNHCGLLQCVIDTLSDFLLTSPIENKCYSNVKLG